MAPTEGAPFSGGLVPRPTEEERKAAIAHPGPTWTEYFFRSFLPTWTALGFLIVDSIIAGYWLETRVYWPMVPSLAVALYLEYLAYQVLWHHPQAGPSASNRPEGGLRRLVHPVTFGRWTEPGERVRRGLSPYSGEAVDKNGPDPAEFF